MLAQSGGPTPVVNASLMGARSAALSQPAVGRVLGARFGIAGMLAGDYVDLTDLSDRDALALERTPGAALGSSRDLPTDPQLEQLALDLRHRGVQWVAMIGGNDTAATLHRLHLAARAVAVPLSVVGIPKTVDNDLPEMDHCPGYGSGARYLAIAAREAGLDTSAMRRSDPIKIIEVAGRNAGWLAAASALGRGQPGDAPQVIFLPERPLSLASMLAAIRAAYDAWGWVVVVIGENQRDDQGQPLAGGAPVYVDPHGHPYHESVGAFLARAAQSALGLRARYERPGSLQRTSALAISEVDVAEAREAGAEAVRLALQGRTDLMVTLQRRGPPYAVAYGAVPLEAVARLERRLPDEFITPSSTDVTEAFLDYARPLIGGALPAVTRL